MKKYNFLLVTGGTGGHVIPAVNLGNFIIEKGHKCSLIVDVRGMNLTNPNYFFERMYNRDPKLFLKKKSGKFNAYSRICAHNMRKQPVIISQEEKDKIDRLHPGSYSEAIKYGSSQETQQYYISGENI